MVAIVAAVTAADVDVAVIKALEPDPKLLLLCLPLLVLLDPVALIAVATAADRAVGG